MDNVRCTECKNWFPSPSEWNILSEYGQEILSDDFLCQDCSKKIDEYKVPAGDYVDC